MYETQRRENIWIGTPIHTAIHGVIFTDIIIIISLLQGDFWRRWEMSAYQPTIWIQYSDSSKSQLKFLIKHTEYATKKIYPKPTRLQLNSHCVLSVRFFVHSAIEPINVVYFNKNVPFIVFIAIKSRILTDLAFCKRTPQ